MHNKISIFNNKNNYQYYSDLIVNLSKKFKMSYYNSKISPFLLYLSFKDDVLINLVII